MFTYEDVIVVYIYVRGLYCFLSARIKLLFTYIIEDKIVVCVKRLDC